MRQPNPGVLVPEAIHSPQDTQAGRVVTLSVGGTKQKLWRKQILPLTTINYDGRQIRFDQDYHKTLVRNFRAGAYPQVPFQLADATNTHTNDPERTRGELVDLRAEPTGLYGYFRLSDPSVVLANRKLGVSCRIVENYSRESDGKKFGHSLQHVLGTLDPKIPIEHPWESVELASAPVSSTIDLSGQFYTEDGGKMPDGTGTEDKVVVELSTSTLEKFNKFLENLDEDGQVRSDQDGDDDEGQNQLDDLTDEEMAALVANFDEDDDPSTEGGDSVGLAVVQSLQSQVLELTNKLDRRDTEHELEQLAATGLAPAIIEAAKPLLAIQSGTIELSNGERVSPSAQVRTLLRTVLDLANRGVDMIDFDQEQGSLGGADSASSVRKSQVDEMDRLYGS